MAGAFFFPQGLADYGTLLWLLALVPAFLLAYYRGWQGAATALAAGMATLSPSPKPWRSGWDVRYPTCSWES